MPSNQLKELIKQLSLNFLILPRDAKQDGKLVVQNHRAALWQREISSGGPAPRRRGAGVPRREGLGSWGDARLAGERGRGDKS